MISSPLVHLIPPNARITLKLCYHYVRRSMLLLSSPRLKVHLPTSHFLGIVINTVTMTASISSERKQELLSALQSMIERRKCTKQQLLSLIGKLSFACKVVPAGRIFLRRLIDLSCSVSRIHHHIRLTKEARLDMYWWFNFLPQWSGTSCILETEWTTTPSMNLYTDASGTLGWGAYWSGRWLQAHWSLNDCKNDIVWKRAFCHSSCSKQLGPPLATKEGAFPL